MNSPRGQREPVREITQPSLHLLAEYSTALYSMEGIAVSGKTEQEWDYLLFRDFISQAHDFCNEDIDRHFSYKSAPLHFVAHFKRFEVVVSYPQMGQCGQNFLVNFKRFLNVIKSNHGQAF